MNVQPVEKYTEDLFLDVHSIFHTIQGEGPFAGTPCVFVRLAGCTLDCPGCDTEYTSGRRKMPVEEVIQLVKTHRTNGLVVITGGEPFRQKACGELIRTLILVGYYVQVETNGTMPAPKIAFNKFIEFPRGAYIVVSPKAGKVHESIEQNALAYKYVLSHDAVCPDDGLPTNVLGNAVRRVARPPKGFAGRVYVQPMDHHDALENSASIEAAIKSSKKFGYTFCYQVHKAIGVE